MPTPVIPAELLPADGRFGSGPSRVRPEQVQVLDALSVSVLGTSHRQAPVKALVGRVRENLLHLFSAPPGYEVALGNGGATAFWDLATFQLIRRRSAHAYAGSFGKKFAAAAAAAPFLEEPLRDETPLGTAAAPQLHDGVDAYSWAQNETSTGAITPVRRLDGPALMLIDATSAAGGMAVDVSQTDAYFFSPQKNFASDGGLWLALLSPAALERSAELAATRWTPASLDLHQAIENSRKNQTLNTPALSTLILLDAQLSWLLDEGGLAWAAQRTAATSAVLYNWAASRDFVRPFVEQEVAQSPVVVTLEFSPDVPAAELSAQLRANGIVDVDPYRGVGGNQLRISTFVNVPPADAEALTACLDFLVERL